MSDDDADPTHSPNGSRGTDDVPPKDGKNTGEENGRKGHVEGENGGEENGGEENGGNDPFAALDDPEDDPVESVENVFETLGSDDGADVRSDRGGDDAETSFSTSDDEGSFDTSDDGEDPFAALEDDGDVADAFDHMEVDELSDEDVWDALGEEEGLGDVAAGAEPDGTDHVVDKREYCQRCPHFSDPPETACMHEEGEILEVLEGDEFRVRNCPMIADEGPRFDRG